MCIVCPTIGNRACSLVIIVSALAMTPVSPLPSLAGDCLSSLQEDVEFLEHTTYSEDTSRDIYYRIFCMRTDFRTDTNRWAGPIAAAYIKSCRENVLHDRIAAVCQTYLGDAGYLGYEAARTMAHYAIGEANGDDIYAVLVSHRDEPPWFDLAILGDPRTVDFIREVYSLRRPKGVDKQANLEALISMLNCLYHLPGDAAVSLAGELLSSEPDPELRERLELVVNRTKD